MRNNKLSKMKQETAQHATRYLAVHNRTVHEQIKNIRPDKYRRIAKDWSLHPHQNISRTVVIPKH